MASAWHVTGIPSIAAVTSIEVLPDGATAADDDGVANDDDVTDTPLVAIDIAGDDEFKELWLLGAFCIKPFEVGRRSGGTGGKGLLGLPDDVVEIDGIIAIDGCEVIGGKGGFCELIEAAALDAANTL